MLALQGQALLSKPSPIQWVQCTNVLAWYSLNQSQRTTMVLFLLTLTCLINSLNLVLIIWWTKSPIIITKYVSIWTQICNLNNSTDPSVIFVGVNPEMISSLSLSATMWLLLHFVGKETVKFEINFTKNQSFNFSLAE